MTFVLISKRIFYSAVLACLMLACAGPSPTVPDLPEGDYLARVQTQTRGGILCSQYALVRNSKQVQISGPGYTRIRGGGQFRVCLGSQYRN